MLLTRLFVLRCRREVLHELADQLGSDPFFQKAGNFYRTSHFPRDGGNHFTGPDGSGRFNPMASHKYFAAVAGGRGDTAGLKETNRPQPLVNSDGSDISHDRSRDYRHVLAVVALAMNRAAAEVDDAGLRCVGSAP